MVIDNLKKKDMKYQLLECYKCKTFLKVNMDYKKKFVVCNYCGTNNEFTNYINKAYGISKGDNKLLKLLKKLKR